jgi:hypothetical protein
MSAASHGVKAYFAKERKRKKKKIQAQIFFLGVIHVSSMLRNEAYCYDSATASSIPSLSLFCVSPPTCRDFLPACFFFSFLSFLFPFQCSEYDELERVNRTTLASPLFFFLLEKRSVKNQIPREREKQHEYKAIIKKPLTLRVLSRMATLTSRFHFPFPFPLSRFFFAT